MTTFPEFLRFKRRQAGLSQDAVAKALGYGNRSNVCRLEAGQLEWKVSSLFQFARLLGVKVSDLLAEFEECRGLVYSDREGRLWPK